jgi:hypothetical protein
MQPRAEEGLFLCRIPCGSGLAKRSAAEGQLEPDKFHAAKHDLIRVPSAAAKLCLQCLGAPLPRSTL